MNVAKELRLYSPQHSLLTLSFAVLALTSACSEDKASLRDAGLDARITTLPEAGPPDAGELGPDASDAHLDPAVDAQTDAGHDAGELCQTVPFPRFTNSFWEPHSGTWVPLDVYCSRDDCPQDVYCARNDCPESLASMMASLTCYDVSADGGLAGADASVGDGGLARREGCGSVQFHALAGYPRYSNFDLQTGALIGAAKSDDIVTSLPGTACRDAHFVAGTFAICADATVKHCQRKLQP
jgi:hypothetical protein